MEKLLENSKRLYLRENPLNTTHTIFTSSSFLLFQFSYKFFSPLWTSLFEIHRDEDKEPTSPILQ